MESAYTIMTVSYRQREMRICYTVQISETIIVHLYKFTEKMQRRQCKKILIYEGKKRKV